MIEQSEPEQDVAEQLEARERELRRYKMKLLGRLKPAPRVLKRVAPSIRKKVRLERKAAEQAAPISGAGLSGQLLKSMTRAQRKRRRRLAR